VQLPLLSSENAYCIFKTAFRSYVMFKLTALLSLDWETKLVGSLMRCILGEDGCLLGCSAM
jgi:hypothetical protein